MARPDEKRPSRVRRQLWILGAALASVAAVAVAVALRFRDTETPVSVAAVVEDFEAAASTTTRPSVTLSPSTASPASTTTSVVEESAVTGLMTLGQPGVYVYVTTGGEETGALSGASHTYPAETTIAVQAGGCGLILRWRPLEERYEEWETCLQDGALVIPRYTTFHEFFGTTDRQDFDCEPAIVLVPLAGDGHGDSTCVAGGLTEIVSTRTLSSKSITVGSQEITAVGVVLEAVLQGDGTGTTRAEMWISEDDGTILSWSEVVDSIAGSVIGDVSYAESFEIQLTSLEPER